MYYPTSYQDLLYCTLRGVLLQYDRRHPASIQAGLVTLRGSLPPLMHHSDPQHATLPPLATPPANTSLALPDGDMTCASSALAMPRAPGAQGRSQREETLHGSTPPFSTQQPVAAA